MRCMWEVVLREWHNEKITFLSEVSYQMEQPFTRCIEFHQSPFCGHFLMTFTQKGIFYFSLVNSLIIYVNYVNL